MGEQIMDLTLIIQSLLGLVSLLAVLLFFLFYSFGEKKAPKEQKAKVQKPKKEIDISLEALRKVFRIENSSKEKLKETVGLILEHHGTIHEKLGSRTHPDFDAYAEILFYLARHKNSDKEIILEFDRGLSSRNPTYKKQINDALMRGLNSRNN